MEEKQSEVLTPPSTLVPEGQFFETETKDTANQRPSTLIGEQNEITQKLRNPGSDALTGAAVGVGTKLLNPVIKAGINTAANVISGPQPPGSYPSIFRGDQTPVEKWSRQMHGGKLWGVPEHGEQYQEVYRKAQEIKAAEAEETARKKAENLFKSEEELKKAAKGEKSANSPIKKAIRHINEFLAPTPATAGLGDRITAGLAHGAGRAVAGGSAAYQGVDAYNRLISGDTPGAALSGVGAVGSAAALIPTPATRVGGAILGALPFTRNLVGDAKAADLPSAGFDIATAAMGPAGMAFMPSELGNATLRPEPRGRSVLEGSTLSPSEREPNTRSLIPGLAQGGLVYLAEGGMPDYGFGTSSPMMAQDGVSSEMMGNNFPYQNATPMMMSGMPQMQATAMNDVPVDQPMYTMGMGGMNDLSVAQPMYSMGMNNQSLPAFNRNTNFQTPRPFVPDFRNNLPTPAPARPALGRVAMPVRPPPPTRLRMPTPIGVRPRRFAEGGTLPPPENAARTQIIGTLPTYSKAATMLGHQGQAIDFGAGLGKGAQALGQGTHTYEPYAKNWTPTFNKASDIPSNAYQRLTNLNVLNVVPPELRNQIVEHIGRVIEPGGKGIITTRGADVMKSQGVAGPEPMSVITSRDTYQKGFTKQELQDYIRRMLGTDFEINKANIGPAGVQVQKKAPSINLGRGASGGGGGLPSLEPSGSGGSSLKNPFTY